MSDNREPRLLGWPRLTTIIAFALLFGWVLVVGLGGCSEDTDSGSSTSDHEQEQTDIEAEEELEDYYAPEAFEVTLLDGRVIACVENYNATSMICDFDHPVSMGEEIPG